MISIKNFPILKKSTEHNIPQKGVQKTQKELTKLYPFMYQMENTEHIFYQPEKNIQIKRPAFDPKINYLYQVEHLFY